MFGEQLKQLRLTMKLTQKELADKLGISPSTIGMYEQGRRDPDTNTVNTLSLFFNVPTDYLIGTGIENNKSKLTSKDQKEISSILHKTKAMLMDQEGLMFDGEPITEDAIDSIISAMQMGIERTKIKNKKFVPKKYK